jgi:TetR/AcrR family transcriptional repressor of nem operon
MRYDTEHKARTRQKILSEAARAIRQNGPDGVAVAGLMSAVGLTHGGFYAHFPSKEELLAAAVDEMFKDAGRRLDWASQDHSAAESMGRYIDFYLSPAHRDLRSAGCPVPALAADLARMDGRVRERFETGVSGMTARIAELLEGLGQQEPRALASSVVAELVGALGLSRAVSDPACSDQILSDSRASLKARLGLEPSPIRPS